MNKKSVKCEKCGGVVGGYSDNYFIMACLCREAEELNYPDYDEDYGEY